MPFPFTFSLSVAGLSNPFSTAHRRSAQVVPTPPTPGTDHGSDSYRHGAGKHPPVQKKLPITRRRPSPVPSPSPVPLSRKRGWEPTFAEPSRSTATLASTSGYLDTPAKYRDMAGSRNASADEFHEVEMFAGDTELPPPTKRRRGLAGSIVSTALSAALIGTAVGLTVYRLWRDRGKESPRLEAEHQHQHTQQPPPPPYQQGEWTPNSTVSTPPVQVTPATPRTRRIRHPVASASKRTYRRTNTNTNNTTIARTRNHGHPASPPSATLFPPAQPEFEFAPEQQGGGGVEDQMDWIGDKLSMLIEEGKRALGREIVVLSDAKEDEVDDGSGAWEEAEGPTTVSRSRSGSGSGSMRRAKRPRSLAPSSTHAFYGHSPSGSPRSPRFFESGSGMSTSMSAPQMITPVRQHTTHSRGGSVEVGSFREDERAWESPEIRESMERARMRAMFVGRR